mgnify:CR=1 FL=1
MMVFKDRRKTPRRPADAKGKGPESDFDRRGEEDFKVTARRNKLLGYWLAEKAGLGEAEAEEYARQVVRSDLDEPGEEDVVRKVMSDIDEKGLGITEDLLRQEMDRLLKVARGQIEEQRS